MGVFGVVGMKFSPTAAETSMPFSKPLMCRKSTTNDAPTPDKSAR